MNSAGSQTNSLPEQAVKLAGKLRALPEMVAWESIRRGMADEDAAIKRNLDAYHNLLHGGRTQSEGETDEMGNIILGDHITQFQHPANPPAPPAQKSGLGKALIGAGLLATGIGAPLGAYFVADALKKPDPPTVVQPIEQPAEPEEKPPIIITEPGKNFDWRVGDPIVE